MIGIIVKLINHLVSGERRWFILNFDNCLTFNLTVSLRQRFTDLYVN